MFDGSAYSMSGNGKYAPNNGTKIEGDAIVYIPPGQGGGCVTTGPFKKYSPFLLVPDRANCIV